MIHKKRLLLIAMFAVVATSQYNGTVNAQTSRIKDVCSRLLNFSGNILSLSWQATKFFARKSYDGSCAVYSASKPYVIAGAGFLHNKLTGFHKKPAETRDQSKVEASRDNSINSIQNNDRTQIDTVEESSGCPICFEQEELLPYCSYSDEHRFCRGCIEDLIKHESDATCSLCRREFKKNMIDDIKQKRAHKLCVYCQGPATEFESLMPISTFGGLYHNLDILSHDSCFETNNR